MLKQIAYGYPEVEEIQQHLTALNVHLNNFDKINSIPKKNGVWKEVEREAENIKALLASMHVEV